ncbi:imidazoleglycerol-phosphate dehydratase HisB [bacterium]
MTTRISKIHRKTKETDIDIKLNLDGKGKIDVSVTISFLEHMLSLFGKHGLFDLEIKATGDTQIDNHHLIEDMGITLGQAIKECLQDKKGITRYGFSSVPMDDSLVECSIDISGRPYLVYNMSTDKQNILEEKEKYELYKHFFYSLVCNADMTLHLNLKYGENLHHNLEAAFKAFGRALKQAVSINPLTDEIPSTKGCI